MANGLHFLVYPGNMEHQNHVVAGRRLSYLICVWGLFSTGTNALWYDLFLSFGREHFAQSGWKQEVDGREFQHPGWFLDMDFRRGPKLAAVKRGA